jgi:hypothetical protein
MKTSYPSYFDEAKISIVKLENYKSLGNGLIPKKLIQARENILFKVKNNYYTTENNLLL